MEQQRFKPREAAKILGTNTWTLRRWIREGHVPAIRSETGRLYVPKEWIDSQLGRETPSYIIRCALYARESSSENKAALQSQLEGLVNLAENRANDLMEDLWPSSHHFVLGCMANGAAERKPKRSSRRWRRQSEEGPPPQFGEDHAPGIAGLPESVEQG